MGGGSVGVGAYVHANQLAPLAFSSASVAQLVERLLLAHYVLSLYCNTILIIYSA